MNIISDGEVQDGAEERSEKHGIRISEYADLRAKSGRES